MNSPRLRTRMLCVYLAALASACSGRVPFAMPFREVEIRVMTFNFQNVFMNADDPAARLGLLLEALEGHRPDLVSLQEIVEAPGYGNGARIVAERAGYAWLWRPTHGVPGVGLEGPALLSRWPIVWSEIRRLPHQDLDGLATRVAPRTTRASFARSSSVGGKRPMRRRRTAIAESRHRRSAWRVDAGRSRR